MKIIYIILLLFVNTLNVFSQVYEDAKYLTHSIYELGGLFGSSPFGCNYQPNITDSIKRDIESTSAGSYTARFPNYFMENFDDPNTGSCFHLIIGIDNREYRIYVFKGATKLRLIATITFNLMHDYGNGWDDPTWSGLSFNLEWTKLGRSYIWADNSNILISREEIPNIMDFMVVYQSEYVKIEVLKKVALMYNPITELNRKAKAFSELSGILNDKLEF